MDSGPCLRRTPAVVVAVAVTAMALAVVAGPTTGDTSDETPDPAVAAMEMAAAVSVAAAATRRPGSLQALPIRAPARPSPVAGPSLPRDRSPPSP